MKKIKDQFVTYEIASAMKELGFDEECFGCFINDTFKPRNQYQFIIGSTYSYSRTNPDIELDYIMAPLWQQCMDWLKEKHCIFVFIDMGKYYDSYEGAYPFQAWCKIYKNKELINSITVRNKLDNENFIFYSYEEAREQAILKCIKLCKKN